MASLWTRRVEVGLRAAAEGLFPTNDEGIPDWQETDLVGRTLDYLEALPPEQRRLVGALYVAIELAPVTVGRVSRLSRLSPERRAETVRAWRTSSNPLLRMLGDALKAQLTMMYLSHPAVGRHTGEVKVTANPPDPYQPRIDPTLLGGGAA